MLKINGFYGNPYVKSPSYNDFVATFSSIGAEVEDLGVGSDGVLHLYGLKYGDTVNKPVIFIDGNCHGSEWWAAHYAVDFIKRIIERDFYDKPIIDAILDTFSFYVIPSSNPWGYETNTYVNFNGVNLNRNTDVMWDTTDEGLGTVNYKGTAPFSEVEAQIIKDKVLELKPYLAVNCHTTTGNYEGIDVGKRYTEYRGILHDCFKASKISLSKHFKGGLEWSLGYAPTFPAWYGQQFSKEGTRTIPTILEMRSDQNTHNYGLTTLFLLTIYTLYFYKTGLQSINSREDLNSIL